ncbi:ABC transporter substrate-binding protein [Duganella radicis]|uniref:ABC transporter substrate-binding protein n=1 Tax=Duganella radicis TaxID=551988 RepID=UPI002810C0AB|nr:ABC transporter substrate-binding protein [Duganella radicis]
METYKRIKRYTDPQAAERDWISATTMVAKGTAGMQLMGDWAKAEIQAAGKRPGIDVLCAPAPGTAQAFTFNIDSFVMFQVSKDKQAAQRDLVRAVMSKEFQENFNLAKGSIPVRLDVPMDRFDECGKRSSHDFKRSASRGSLMPSLLNGSLPSPVVSAISDVISQFWHQDAMSPAETMARLAAIAAKAAPAGRQRP